MSEIALLADDELKIIQEHRAKKAKIEHQFKMQTKALNIAVDYITWLKTHKRITTFSTFVDEFGYEEEDCSFMYKVVINILEVSDQWG